MKTRNYIGAALAGAILLSGTACSTTRGIGDVLGGVLNAPSNQIEGTVQGVDTRAQQIFLRDNNDQLVAITYDNRTQVRYQQQTYAVSSLDPGDEVTVRVQQNGNDTYYTDLIEVVRPSSTSGGGNLVSVQGTVRSVDTQRGLFTMTSSNQIVTVSLPYNARAVDVDRLRSLRIGQSVRVQGTWLSDTRIELYQFM